MGSKEMQAVYKHPVGTAHGEPGRVQGEPSFPVLL